MGMVAFDLWNFLLAIVSLGNNDFGFNSFQNINFS